jgi:hypothetical protein
MNHLYAALLAVSCVAIAGCGKSIPDCGDAKVTDLARKVIEGIFAKETQTPLPALQEHFAVGMNVSKVTIAGKMTKFDMQAITSLKKDKESGANTCTALLDGEHVRTITVTPSKESFGVFGSGSDVVEAKIKLLGAAEMKALGKLSIDDKGAYLFTLSEKLPSKIEYEAVLTDKGDQVLVKAKIGGS